MLQPGPTPTKPLIRAIARCRNCSLVRESPATSRLLPASQLLRTHFSGGQSASLLKTLIRHALSDKTSRLKKLVQLPRLHSHGLQNWDFRVPSQSSDIPLNASGFPRRCASTALVSNYLLVGRQSAQQQRNRHPWKHAHRHRSTPFH